MTAPSPKTIEAKVTASTLVTLAASIAVAVLNAVQDNPGLLAPLPPLAQTAILLLVPPLLTFAAGYRTPSNRIGDHG